MYLENGRFSRIQGTGLFYTGNIPDWAGLYGSGEYFHPRTTEKGSNGYNLVFERTEEQKHKNAIAFSKLFSSEETKLIYANGKTYEETKKIHDEMHSCQIALNKVVEEFLNSQENK